MDNDFGMLPDERVNVYDERTGLFTLHGVQMPIEEALKLLVLQASNCITSLKLLQ